MTWQFRSKSQVLSAATLPVPGIFLPPGAWTSHKLVQCCLQGKARCLDMTHTSRAEAEATGHLQVTHTPTTKQLLRRKEGVQGAVERALGCGTEEGKGPEPPGLGPLRGSHLLGQCPAVARGLSFYLSCPLERPKGPGSQWPGLGLWRAAAAAVGSHAAPGPLVGP